MHELSIVMGIVRIAKTETEKANATSVNHIELEIGTLAGIEYEALDFVWPMAVKDTILEHAEKKVTVVNAEARCDDCHTLFKLDTIYEACPKCNSYLKNIVKGKELIVKSLRVSTAD